MELNITIPPFPGKWKGPKHMTAVQDAWFRENFPCHRNDDICKAMGIAIRTLSYAAKELGLTKTDEYRHRIAIAAQSTPGRVAQGRKMMQQYWKDVREGRRLKPVDTLKQRDPEKYVEYCKQMSQNVKRRIETKKFRLRMGLPTNDRINATLHPYTRSQSTRRHTALRLGYVLADDYSEQGGHRFVIYYDEETVRRPKFEENCINAGFKIELWQEDQ